MSEYIEVTGPIFETKVVNTATEPLPIYIVNPSTGTEINQFSEVLSVPTGVLTLIGSYTVPVGKTFQLQWVSVSGTNIGKYVLKKNGSTLDQAYTYFSGGLSFQFEFPNGGISLAAGDVLSVSIVHQRLSVGDFNTRIQGIEF